MTTHTFHVKGMHCQACVLLTESELQDVEYITKAKSNLALCCVEVTGEFGDRAADEIAQDLTRVLAPHGYELLLQPAARANRWSDYALAIPIALAVVAGFILLQKLGIVNLINTGSVTYATAFMIGIVASLSTCMAVVGGLVLSLSATFAKTGDRVRPQVWFHASRLVSFFILGGIIGSLGAAFTLNTAVTSALSVAVGLVMLLLGLNLLDVFAWTKRLQPSMPKFVSRRAWGAAKANHTFTPLLVGVATFFLPCGFTQSMQLYTLTTGSFIQGGLTMLTFALGTLPVLALISFSSLGIQKRAQSGVFFKTAGLIVIFFALLNLTNSLVVLGVIPPVFNF